MSYAGKCSICEKPLYEDEIYWTGVTVYCETCFGNKKKLEKQKYEAYHQTLTNKELKKLLVGLKKQI